MIGILCSIDLHVSIASNPERYRPLHCHFHFGYDIEGRQRMGYARSHKLLVDDTRQSTGRSLILLSMSSLITARSGYCSTLYTGMPTIELSCLDCVLRLIAPRFIGKIRSCHQKLAQTCPKYSGENKIIGGKVIIIDKSLGVSQLWGTRARCAPKFIRYKLIIDVLHWLPVSHQPPKGSLSARGSRSLRSSKRKFW